MAPSPTLRERLVAGLADRSWPWPLGLSLLAAVPLLDRAAALTVGTWLAASAAAVAWWLHRATPAIAQPLPPAAAASAALHDERNAAPDDPRAAELSGLLTQVLPVWNSHIESVRAQTEQAVDELVRSFAGINAQFEAAGFIGAHDENQRRTTFTLLTLCERQLRPVVSSMGKILESKTSLVNCVNELANATQELKGMANDVSQIAAHTNILAINAAIEAAHAGDAGRGFAVIAKAIRELSQTSASAGKRIAERMAQIESLMVATVEKANQTAQDDGEAIELSGTVVQDVLAHVRALGESAEDMRNKGAEIRRDTDNLLLHLQFQDRTSQILGAVEGDIDRLRDAVEGGRPVPDPQAWLEEMSQRYTMDDQRQATQQRGAVGAAASEIEFF